MHSTISHTDISRSTPQTLLLSSRYVSATTMDTEGTRRAMVRPKVPNYTLRRIVVGSLALVTVGLGLLAMVGAFAVIDGSPVVADDGARAAGAGQAVHVAQPGDTLWSISDSYRGDIDRDTYIQRLIALNNGPSIQVGQAVRLP